MSKPDERRIIQSKLTLRSAGGKKFVSGYAARFRTKSSDLGGFKETLCPGCSRCAGAFSRAIRERQDVKLLFNHDSNSLPLARTKSGTMTLTQDTNGLRFDAELGNNQFSADLAASVARGDLDGCSFAFKMRDESWGVDQEEDGSDFPLRTLHDMDLFDVSIVNYPAYPTGTSVDVSSVSPDLLSMCSVSPRALQEARARGGYAPKSKGPVVVRELMTELERAELRGARIKADDDAAYALDVAEFNQSHTVDPLTKAIRKQARKFNVNR